MWPADTCSSMGLSGKSNVTLLDMVAAMVNASNTPAAARAINGRLQDLMDAGGGGGGDDGAAGSQAALGMVTGLELNCTDVATTFVETAAEINQLLYCGYFQSRCGGEGPQQLAAAFDWRGTGARR